MSRIAQQRATLKGRQVVGVDVAKRELVAFAAPKGHRIFQNTASGFQSFVEWVKPVPTTVALEPTGIYGKAFQTALSAQGIEVVLINPMHTHKAKELLDNHPGKNDHKDAELLVELAERGYGLTPLRREGVYAELHAVNQSLGRISRQLAVHRGWREALRFGAAQSHEEVTWQREDFRRLGQRRRKLEQQLRELVTQVPYLKGLLTIPGLPAISVARLVAETGDLRQYPSARAVLKRAGLSLHCHASGQFRGQNRITRRGSSKLRWLLYFMVLRLIRKGGVLRERYEQLRGRGKAAPVAMVACMRTLLRWMMALVKSGESFQRRGERSSKGSLEAAQPTSV